MNKKLIIAVFFALGAVYIGLRQPSPAPQDSDEASDITWLTAQQRVADYFHQHDKLPLIYMTKNEARQRGWQPEKGNLCEVLPGRAIGGDRFSNREKRLPEKKGRRWYEADVNYRCGRRSSDRMLYSSDGRVFVTRDHYLHFERIY